jgi:hypothetical protein
MCSTEEFPIGIGLPFGVAKEDPPPVKGRRVKLLNKTNRTRPDHEREAKITYDELSSSEFFGDGSMKNPIEFREWFKILFRVWRPFLLPNEFLVVQFIFDRTAGWGKEWEIIRTSHFLGGVIGADCKIYSTGLVISRPTLAKCIERLVLIGAIRKKLTKRGKAYALNYEWNPEILELKTDMPIPKPKRLQGLQIQKMENNFLKNPKMENNFTKECKETFHHKKRKDKSYAKEEYHRDAVGVSPAPQGGTLLDLCMLEDSVKRKTAKARMNLITRWTGDAPSKAWYDLCKEFHPDSNHLAVTKTDCSILRKYGSRFIKLRNLETTEQWLSYLSWVIERWHVIRDTELNWMKAASPAVPSIRFIVRFSDVFEQAWATKHHFDHLATLSVRDREVELRVAKGIERDVAEREVDKRLGLLKAKEDADYARKALKRQQASFENAKADHVKADERNAQWREIRQASSTSSGGTFEQWE